MLWLDMRIQPGELGALIEALQQTELCVEVLTIDLHPPAAGPEVEVTMPMKVAINERVIRRVIARDPWNVIPIAVRTRTWPRGVDER